VGKNKHLRFAENATFTNLLQASFNDVFNKDHEVKGHWCERYFAEKQPLVLELGCGKGEYTVGLANAFPDKNYIGIDIKGARLWLGAKTALQQNMRNVAFLRTRIEFIQSFFATEEVSEIWFTFPDPQEKTSRIKKRLTSPTFLKLYQKFLINNGIVHLKTDNDILYEYTKAIALHNKFDILFATNDLYASNLPDEILNVKTFYEQQYLAVGKTIKYIKFKLPQHATIENIPNEEFFSIRLPNS
jgi:tRNA (guanine-N7-)-methyltransferase